MATSYNYVKSSGGIASEDAYPYVNGGVSNYTAVCKASTSVKVANLTTYTYVAANDAALLTALTTYGPIAIGIDASLPSLQVYAFLIFRFEMFVSI